jgi:hypothetical protein
MKVVCEKCEFEEATKFYRDYRGPHALCDKCFYRTVKHTPIKHPSSKEEYVEEILIDQIMTQ